MYSCHWYKKGVVMEKIGLVLEGGGVRGAYTAGALAWLQDNNITFDYSVVVLFSTIIPTKSKVSNN